MQMTSPPKADAAGPLAGTPPPHPLLATLFLDLDAENVSWCLLRGRSDLHAPKGDVDLLVAHSEFPQMQRIAERVGFARIPSWGDGSHVFFLAYDSSDDLWIKLDTVTELAFGPDFALPTGTELECLARRRTVGGVYALADADEFWALLLHELLDKERTGSAPARVTARLAELAPCADPPGPVGALVDALAPASWNAERLATAAARGDWASLREVAPRLAAAWRRRDRRAVQRRAMANRLRRQWGKALRPIRRHGASVALLGPDGVGKSTLVSGIESSFYFPTRSVYMGLYQRTSGSRLRRADGVGFAIRLVTQWLRVLEAGYQRRRGRLVLLDRYSYDAMLPSHRPRNRRSMMRRWLLAHSCPAPDLVLVLDAPAEMMHARKDEHDVAFLETQREAFRMLAERLPRALVVDASRDADVVRRDVTGAIWKEYARRWSPTPTLER